MYLTVIISLFSLAVLRLLSALHLHPLPLYLLPLFSPITLSLSACCFLFLKWMPSVSILSFSSLSNTWYTSKWMEFFCLSFTVFPSLSAAHPFHFISCSCFFYFSFSDPLRCLFIFICIYCSVPIFLSSFLPHCLVLWPSLSCEYLYVFKYTALQRFSIFSLFCLCVFFFKCDYMLWNAVLKNISASVIFHPSLLSPALGEQIYCPSDCQCQCCLIDTATSNLTLPDLSPHPGDCGYLIWSLSPSGFQQERELQRGNATLLPIPSACWEVQASLWVLRDSGGEGTNEVASVCW